MGVLDGKGTQRYDWSVWQGGFGFEKKKAGVSSGQQNLHSSNRWHLRGNRRRLECNRRRLEGNRRRLEGNQRQLEGNQRLWETKGN